MKFSTLHRLLSPLLLCCVPLAQGEVYRWVDEQGQVHYGDVPQDSQAYQLRTLPQTQAPPTETQRMEKTRRLLRAYEAERQQQREAQRKQQEQQAKRKRDCIRARDGLRAYKESGNIYRLDEAGQRVYFSEPERQALLQRYRKAVSDHCD